MYRFGAFQGFRGSVYLNNKEIVKFQDMIKTDVAAPLDLVTPPEITELLRKRS